MPTVDLPGMRSISTDSAFIARQRSSARPVIFAYFTPASGLNSNVVTTGPGMNLDDACLRPRTRGTSPRAGARSSISSRSSILRSVFGASSSDDRRQRVLALAALGRRLRHRLRIGQRQRRRDDFGGLGGANDFGPLRGRCGIAAGGAGWSWSLSWSARRRGRARSSPWPARSRPRHRRDRRDWRPTPWRPRALISGAGAPFLVCFAITSRRCCSRRRSSRQARKRLQRRESRRRAHRRIAAAKNRPNENCVEMMIASTISVSTTMTEPVRFRYSDIWRASNSPA